MADTTDAWVGGMGDRARTLAIMQDPTSGPGPMAVTALVLVLLLKCAALATLLPHAPGALWLAPLLARAAVVAAFLTTPYVRAGGLGSALTGASRRISTLAVLVAIAVTCAAGPSRAVLAVAIAAVVFALWRCACLRRLGGMTGDTCGALIELSETAVLVGLAVSAG